MTFLGLVIESCLSSNRNNKGNNLATTTKNLKWNHIKNNDNIETSYGENSSFTLVISFTLHNSPQ